MYILRGNQCGAKTYNSKLRGSPLDARFETCPQFLVEVFPQTPAPPPPTGYVQETSMACSSFTLFSKIDTRLDFFYIVTYREARKTNCKISLHQSHQTAECVLL